VTGDGWVARQLYSDSGLCVLSFRRVVALTSIDPGAIRGDLGDRLLLCDLDPIPEDRRRTEADLLARYDALRPRLLGGLLDLLAAALARLPAVRPSRLPRMADFGRLLAAIDALDGGDALARYVAQAGRVAADVIEADAVGLAVLDLVRRDGAWTGTAAELLAAIAPERPPKDWPPTPRALAARLRRLTPALAAAGVAVEFRRAAGGDRKRTIALAPALGGGTVGDGLGRSARPTVPQFDPGNSGGWDDRDGRDAKFRAISGGDGFRDFSPDDDGEPPDAPEDRVKIVV
jgi:hypothetical protein